jgi:hypothetical protein
MFKNNFALIAPITILLQNFTLPFSPIFTFPNEAENTI